MPLALILGLGACEEEDVCGGAARVDDPGLEIGYGEESFEWAIQDGDAVPRSYGSQGGQHLWLAVRTKGFAPGDPRPFGGDRDIPRFMIELLELATGETKATQHFGFEAMEGDVVSAELALGEFFLPWDDETGDGEPPELLLRVTGEDVCGNVLEAERLVTLE